MSDYISDPPMDLNKVTDGGRFQAFFSLLRDRARELQPDFPFVKDDAFDWLWAITSGYEGTELANEDCHLYIGQLREALNRLIAVRETQRKRESEEFHLSAPSFMTIWDEADKQAQEVYNITRWTNLHDKHKLLVRAAESVLGDPANVKQRDNMRAVLDNQPLPHPHLLPPRKS